MAPTDVVHSMANLPNKNFSKDELHLFEQQLKLDQAQISAIRDTVNGVIGITRDLLEIKKIRDQGAVQMEIMNKKGELMRQELLSFTEKNSLNMSNFEKRVKVVHYFTSIVNEQLNNQNCSDAVKQSTLDFYGSVLTALLKA